SSVGIPERPLAFGAVVDVVSARFDAEAARLQIGEVRMGLAVRAGRLRRAHVLVRPLAVAVRDTGSVGSRLADRDAHAAPDQVGSRAQELGEVDARETPVALQVLVDVAAGSLCEQLCFRSSGFTAGRGANGDGSRADDPTQVHATFEVTDTLGGPLPR